MSMSATPTTITTPTREAWLLAGAELLWPRIVAAGGTRPDICRVSCGWPSSSALMRASSRSRTLGEAWHAGSEDGAREVFISPALHRPVEVLGVLAHELVHAACEPGQGHGPIFAAICRKIGLTDGKPTQAMPGEFMLEELAEMVGELGPYPHAKLDRMPGPKQKARLMKVYCPACECIVRMTRTWIDTYLPTCGCGSPMISAEYDVEGEPLHLESSHVAYVTGDGRFRLSTTKHGRREGKWTVTELLDEEGALVEGTLRWTIRHSREDAMAFIAAVRSGETDFPEVEVGDAHPDEEEDWVDEDELGELGDWSLDPADEHLDDDELEHLDFDIEADAHPDDDAFDYEEYERTSAAREASGERKSRSIVMAGGIGALD
jgi:hypothetical protein